MKKSSKEPNQAMSVLLTEKRLPLKNVFEQGLRVFANNPAYLNRWLKMPNQHLAKASEDGPCLDPSFEYPTEDQLFSQEKPDLFAAAKENQKKLRELADRNPFPDKAHPTPLSMLNTAEGIQFVSRLLGRLEYGVYI